MTKRASHKLLGIFIAILILLPSSGYSNTGRGTIVAVADGDTVTLLRPDKTQEKIRLYGIDCPEKRQAFGTRAKQFTAMLVFGKTVTIRRVDRDRYGRTIAWVEVNGRSLNKELLKAGLAWHYKRYSNDSELAELETEARLRRQGLWADPSPTAPWEFRRRTRR